MNSKKYNKVKKVKNNKTTRNRNKFTKKNKKIQKRNRNKFTKKMIGGDDPPASSPAPSNAPSPAPSSANSPAPASANASSPGNPPNNAPTNALDNAQGNPQGNAHGNVQVSNTTLCEGNNCPEKPLGDNKSNNKNCAHECTEHNTQNCKLCKRSNDVQIKQMGSECFSPEQRCTGLPSTPFCVGYRNIVKEQFLKEQDSEKGTNDSVKCKEPRYTRDNVFNKMIGLQSRLPQILDPKRSPGPGARFTYTDESNA